MGKPSFLKGKTIKTRPSTASDDTTFGAAQLSPEEKFARRRRSKAVRRGSWQPKGQSAWFEEIQRRRHDPTYFHYSHPNPVTEVLAAHLFGIYEEVRTSQNVLNHPWKCNDAPDEVHKTRPRRSDKVIVISTVTATYRITHYKQAESLMKMFPPTEELIKCLEASNYVSQNTSMQTRSDALAVLKEAVLIYRSGCSIDLTACEMILEDLYTFRAADVALKETC